MRVHVTTEPDREEKRNLNMKLLLIAPASGRWKNVGRSRLLNGKTFRFSYLSLLSVAAETPSDVEIRIIDEQVEDIPWQTDVDLVGITCMTALAPHAYEIAGRFRQRGIPVVLGGMHPTLCPEEAIQHADAIVVGDVESIWHRVLTDLREGHLRGIYRNTQPSDLAGLKAPPRHLIGGRRYAAVAAVQATRGCPHSCQFCSVSAFHKGTQRRRPVEEVVKEIRGLNSRFLVFVDDNLTADREYASCLFGALFPLKKWWVMQSTLAITEDEHLVRLAARAGCVGIFAGLETFSERNLADVNKTCHHASEYRRAVKFLHTHGITVEAGVVLGFDGDTPEVFRRTLNALDDIGVDLAQISILTPLPGTPQFETLKSRVFDRDWSHYDFHHSVFTPRNLSAADLQAGHDWMTRQFYAPTRILKRMARHLLHRRGLVTLPYLLAVNLAYYGRVLRWNIRGWDPAAQKTGFAALPAYLQDQLTGLMQDDAHDLEIIKEGIRV
jgi:radical SAM superfamily enzyme YgiQ (UPF0313 family)